MRNAKHCAFFERKKYLYYGPFLVIIGGQRLAHPKITGGGQVDFKPLFLPFLSTLCVEPQFFFICTQHPESFKPEPLGQVIGSQINSHVVVKSGFLKTAVLLYIVPIGQKEV